MENFNTIPSAGTYGSAIALINANFSLTKEQLERLSYSREGFCGMYDTPVSLGEAYPNPTTGSFAYVGTSFPMDVYTATNGVWAKTIEDGYSGGGIDLTQYADEASLNALAGRVTALENAGYVFIGIATPSGSPSPSQAKRFALAWAAGTYTYYGGFVLNSGEMAVLMYNGSAWSGAKTDIIAKGVVGGYDTTPTEDSEKPITSGGVYTAMDELRSDMEDELSNVDMEFGSGEYVSDVIIHNSVGQNESVLLTQVGITSFVFNEIDINDIDNLNNIDYAYSPSQSQSKKTSYYTVVTFRGAGATQKVKIGTMAVISDGLAGMVTEVMTTRYTLDASGNLTGEFSNNDVFTIYRSTSGNTWTQWHYVNESVWSEAINSIRTDLTNYYTKSQTYSRIEVDNLIAAINQFEYIVVNSLPYPPSANTMRKIYLIPSAHSVTQNVKDEYITIQDGNSYKWEQIGSTAVDLSGYSTTAEMNTAINAAIASALISYYTKTQVDTLLDEKQDVIDDLSTIRSGAAAGATAVQPAAIANFATMDYVGEAIDDAIDAIPVDDEPTAGSPNLVKSGGVSKFKSYNYTKNDYTNSLVKEIHIEGTKSPGMKYYVRSCKRFYSDTSEGSFFYFAVRSHDTIGTAEEETICEFSSGSNIRNSGVYTSTNGDYTVTILVVLDNQADNTGAVSYASYSEGLELNDICWGDLENAPIISASLRASSIEINNPSAVSSDTVYRNLVKTGANHQIRFYITKFYGAENNEEFMTALARIPLAERFPPCAVLHRNAGLWSMYIFRGSYTTSDVSDTYWLDQGYWTKVLTETDISQILSNIGDNNYTKNSYVNSCIKEIHIEGHKDPSLKYFVRSCLKRGRHPETDPISAYFAIQSYDPETSARVTICEFTERYLIRRSGVYIDSRTTASGDSYKTFILLNVTDSDTNDGGIAGASYTEGLEINDNCWGSFDNASSIASYVREHNASCNHVDLIMFMGQSNMAGRGLVNTEHPQTAPIIYGDIAYEFRAISDPTKLYPVAEPFGKDENNPEGIDDGNKKTGSMVSAFCLAYYATCKATIVGVSASVGGTWSQQWLPSGTLLPDAITRLRDAITFLNNNGYIIDHKYMAWCQGETDGDNSTAPSVYKENFETIFNAMKVEGIEKCFMIRIGHYNGSAATDYSSIINAQSDICREEEDVIMASTALSSFKNKGLMKDRFHYYQEAYNIVGTFAGRNAGLYRKYGICKPQYDSMTESMFFTDKDY